MASRQGFWLHARVPALATLASLLASAAFAADVAEPEFPPGVPDGAGIVCTLDDPFALAATAATLPWPSVWLGHFSGGRPYSNGTGRTLVDWRDEKVCFASRSVCEAWIAALRRSYSDPEGDWTCLFLR
jgi:hypothetical protein